MTQYHGAVLVGQEPGAIQDSNPLEVLPSDPGRPIYLDQVALDFPELTIIGSHTGWPWCEELIALAWKHPNVCLDVSAHLPKYLDPSIISFMDSRGRKKCLFGTNGIGLARCKEQFMELHVDDETKRAVLHPIRATSTKKLSNERRDGKKDRFECAKRPGGKVQTSPPENIQNRPHSRIQDPQCRK